MTKEQEEKLGKYLGDEKVNVIGWYKKGKNKDIRVLEIDGTLSRNQLNEISKIMEMEEMQISSLFNDSLEKDTLVICWVEK